LEGQIVILNRYALNGVVFGEGVYENIFVAACLLSFSFDMIKIILPENNVKVLICLQTINF